MFMWHICYSCYYTLRILEKLYVEQSWDSHSSLNHFFLFLRLFFFDIVGLVLLTMWALILYIFLKNLVKTSVLLRKFALETHALVLKSDGLYFRFSLVWLQVTWRRFCPTVSMSCPWLVYLWAENARVLCGKHYFRCVRSLNVPRRETTSASSDTVGLL